MTERQSLLLYLVLPALIGVLLLLYSTVPGLGVSTDSLAYFEAGHNFAEGHGVTLKSSSGEYSPFRSFPPLFSVVIGTIEKAGLHPLSALRWLNAVIFFLTIFLTGSMLFRFTASIAFSAAGLVLTMISLALFPIYAYAWSEPLFLLFLVAGWFSLFVYFQSPDLIPLIAAGLFTSLALLTRYAAIAMLGAAGLSILLFSKAPRIKKISDSILYGIIGTLPLLLWFMMTRRSGSPMYAQASAFHPFSMEHLNSALYTISLWVVPESVPGIVKRIALAILLIFIALLVNRFRTNRENGAAIPGFLGLFVLVYALVVGLTISLYWTLWANNPVDARLLSPVFLAALISVIYMIKKAASQRSLSILAVVCFVMILSYATQVAHWAMQVHQAGIGYNSKAWQNSPVVAEIKESPASVQIFSNQPMILQFLTGRFAREIPVSAYHYNDAWIVYLYENSSNGLTERALNKKFSLKLRARSPEGAVYTIKK